MECPAFTYSENKDAAGLTAKNIRLFPGHVEFEAVSREEIQRIHLPIPGGFTIYNALAGRLLRALPGADAGGDCRLPPERQGGAGPCGGGSGPHRLYGAH